MPNPGPASSITQNYLLQGNSSDGYQIGSLSTTPVGMYGATPVAQRKNANQISVSQAAACGVLFSVNTQGLSPNVVGTSQAQTQAITITNGSPFVVGDMLLVNKPTAQAGLGILNARVSTASIAVLNFANLTAAGVTPTAGEAYSFQALRSLATSISITPTSVTALTVASQTFSVTGLAPNMFVAVQAAASTLEQPNLGIAGARVVSNGVLGIDFINVSQAPITPTAGSYNIFAANGLNALNNLIVLGANIGASTGIAAGATTTIQIREIALTVSTIAADDTVVGISKPSAQGAVGLLGGRVSSANVIALSFIIGSAAATPTANEVYNVTLYRANPVAPMSLLTQAITPTSVAASTTAEQTFTVTGISASTFVYGVKPSATPGLGIVGWRVAGANSVGITFANPTSAAITPPSETYLFANFNNMPNSQSWYQQQVSISANALTNLANDLRTTLVNLGPITGG